jgi:uncharacterized protein YdgA (DUF945 family)/cytochrome c551/c552
MTKTKIVALAFVLLVVTIYLSSTWLIGSSIETIMADNDSKIENQLPLVKVSERKFERGFFQSSETAKITLNLPGTEHIQFTLKSTIRNGPIPNMSGFAAAVVDSELRVNEGYQQDVMNWLASGVLLTSHSTYPLIGQEGESLVTVPGFNTPRLSWNGMTLKINFSKDLSHLRLQGDVPKMELHWAGGTSLNIAGFHYDGDQKQVFSDDPTLYSGNHKMTISQLDMIPSNQGAGATFPPLITAKEISISDTSTLIGNEFLDYVEKGYAKTLEVNKQDYGPTHLDISVNHIHARTLSDLIQNSHEVENQPTVPLKSPQVIALRQELIKHGMEINIDQLSFTTPQGEASLSSSIKLNDAAPIDFTDRNALVRNFSIKTEVSVPEEFVRSLQKKYGPSDQTEDQANAKIQDAVGHGYVVRDGAMLKSNIELKNGQVWFNGILFVPPAPPAYVPQQPGAFSGSTLMPPLAIKLNCVACHAVDRRIVGPSWMEIAKRYHGATQFEYNGRYYPLAEGLVMKVSRGGSGHWGLMPMPAIDPMGTKQFDITELVHFVLNLESNSPPYQPPKLGNNQPSLGNAPVPPFHLDESLPQFMAQMGNPTVVGATINPHTASADHEMTMIEFPGRGIRLFFRNDNHLLETIRFDAPYAGKVKGIGIGDSLSTLLSNLGSPIRPPWSSAGSKAYLFKDGAFSTRYDIKNGSVLTILMLDR